jgi:hypothetical protein
VNDLAGPRPTSPQARSITPQPDLASSPRPKAGEVEVGVRHPKQEHTTSLAQARSCAPSEHPVAACHGLPAEAVTLAMCGACDLLIPCRAWALTAPNLEPLATVAGYTPAALAAARRARHITTPNPQTEEVS